MGNLLENAVEACREGVGLSSVRAVC